MIWITNEEFNEYSRKERIIEELVLQIKELESNIRYETNLAYEYKEKVKTLRRDINMLKGEII